MPIPCASNDGFSLPDDSDAAWAVLSRTGEGSGCDEAAAAEASFSAASAADVADFFRAKPTPAPPTARAPSGAFLSCNGANAKALTDQYGVEKLDLRYDYEIGTAAGADLAAAVRAFEVGLLEAVAEEFDLRSCEYLGRRRHLRKDDAAFVAGVGSYPFDQEDPVHTQCEALSPGAASACTPINGHMTAWVAKADDPGPYARDIYAAIAEHSASYAQEGVAVAYLGAREPAASAPIIARANQDTGVRDAPAAPAGPRSPIAITGIAVASLLAVLYVAAMVVRLRRKERKEAEAGEEAPAREAAPKSLPDRSLVLQEDRTEARSEDDWSEGSASQRSWSERATILPNGTMASDAVQILPHEERMATTGSFEVSL